MTTGALSSPLATISLNLQPGQVALAVPQPADPRRQPLERHALTGHRDPPAQPLVVGEQLEDRPVGRGDVGRVAGERRPAERPLALAEQRPDVRRHEAREVEGPVEPALAGLVADRVAVVEDLGAAVHGTRPSPRRGGPSTPAAAAVSPAGSFSRSSAQSSNGDAGRQVVERVVGARLVGDDVDRRLALAAARGPSPRRCRAPRSTADAARRGPRRRARARGRASRPARRGSGARSAGRSASRRTRCRSRRRRSS